MAFEIKRNDRRPRLRVQLTSNSVPVDLTAAVAVRFYMKDSPAGATKINQLATFVDRTTGTVEYAWATADTTTAGNFVAEFEVDWGGTPVEKQTFPSTGYFAVTINEDLV